MTTPVKPTTSGPAFRVTILGPQQAESYEGVHVELDARHGVVHVLSADGATHYLSIPAGMALVEWRDPAVLEPMPRMAPFGSRGLERLGEQVRQFSEGIGRGLNTPNE